jgi:hypothetical protein
VCPVVVVAIALAMQNLTETHRAEAAEPIPGLDDLSTKKCPPPTGTIASSTAAQVAIGA